MTEKVFDDGGFRRLIELKLQANSGTSLFSFKFDCPGTHVFFLHSDPNQKIYVRVMLPNTRCPDVGPFLPATTSNLVQLGISRKSRILTEPDWLVLGVILLLTFSLIFLLILALVAFRKRGWHKDKISDPKFRKMAREFNFDDYSSKGSAMKSEKKLNRASNQQRPSGVDNAGFLETEAPKVPIEDETERKNRILQESAIALLDDEFWDYDKQIDLESFSAQKVYDILTSQSHDMTLELGKIKDDAKNLYQV